MASFLSFHSYIGLSLGSFFFLFSLLSGLVCFFFLHSFIYFSLLLRFSLSLSFAFTVYGTPLYDFSLAPFSPFNYIEYFISLLGFYFSVCCSLLFAFLVLRYHSIKVLHFYPWFMLPSPFCTLLVYTTFCRIAFTSRTFSVWPPDDYYLFSFLCTSWAFIRLVLPVRFSTAFCGHLPSTPSLRVSLEYPLYLIHRSTFVY